MLRIVWIFISCNACENVSVVICGINEKFCFPRVVWSHWDNEILPEDIEEMVNVSGRSLANFTHVLLTPKNIRQFCEIVHYPNGYFKMQYVQQKSDYIRVSVLERHGGLYIDSSTYVNSANEVEWAFSEGMNCKKQVVTFIGAIKEFSFAISPEFLMACTNSSSMKRLKLEYDVALEDDLWIYILKAHKDFQSLSLIHQKPTNYSLFCYVVIRASYNNDAFRDSIHFLDNSRRTTKLIEECEYRKSCMRNRLFNDPVARAYPWIKIWHRFRNGKKFYIGDKDYNEGLLKKKEKSH